MNSADALLGDQMDIWKKINSNTNNVAQLAEYFSSTFRVISRNIQVTFKVLKLSVRSDNLQVILLEIMHY